MVRYVLSTSLHSRSEYHSVMGMIYFHWCRDSTLKFSLCSFLASGSFVQEGIHSVSNIGRDLLKQLFGVMPFARWHGGVGDGPICQWLWALLLWVTALRGRLVPEEIAHRQKDLYPHRKSQVLNWTHTQDTEKGKAYTLNNQKSIISQHQFFKNLSQCLET